MGGLDCWGFKTFESFFNAMTRHIGEGACVCVPAPWNGRKGPRCILFLCIAWINTVRITCCRKRSARSATIARIFSNATWSKLNRQNSVFNRDKLPVTHDSTPHICTVPTATDSSGNPDTCQRLSLSLPYFAATAVPHTVLLTASSFFMYSQLLNTCQAGCHRSTESTCAL